MIFSETKNNFHKYTDLIFCWLICLSKEKFRFWNHLDSTFLMNTLESILMRFSHSNYSQILLKFVHWIPIFIYQEFFSSVKSFSSIFEKFLFCSSFNEINLNEVSPPGKTRLRNFWNIHGLNWSRRDLWLDMHFEWLTVVAFLE